MLNYDAYNVNNKLKKTKSERENRFANQHGIKTETLG